MSSDSGYCIRGGGSNIVVTKKRDHDFFFWEQARAQYKSARAKRAKKTTQFAQDTYE